MNVFPAQLGSGHLDSEVLQEDVLTFPSLKFQKSKVASHLACLVSPR